MAGPRRGRDNEDLPIRVMVWAWPRLPSYLYEHVFLDHLLRLADQPLLERLDLLDHLIGGGVTALQLPPPGDTTLNSSHHHPRQPTQPGHRNTATTPKFAACHVPSRTCIPWAHSTLYQCMHLVSPHSIAYST